jgi:hypothetical protein
VIKTWSCEHILSHTNKHRLPKHWESLSLTDPTQLVPLHIYIWNREQFQFPKCVSFSFFLKHWSLNYVHELSGPKYGEKLTSATKFHSVVKAKAVSHIMVFSTVDTIHNPQARHIILVQWTGQEGRRTGRRKGKCNYITQLLNKCNTINNKVWKRVKKYWSLFFHFLFL